MMGEFGLLGVPSSAAAHGPGQEKAPAALRRAGLPERLTAAGARVADYGDLPVVRWRPDPQQRRPHNLQAVLDVLGEASRRVGEILADGRVPLVLGGECSVTIAVMAAFRDRGIEPALLYMDGGVDLFTPATNPTGILDSMGVAHLLDEPGTAVDLAGLGPARPLLRADRLLLFGYHAGPWAGRRARRVTPWPETRAAGLEGLRFHDLRHTSAHPVHRARDQYPGADGTDGALLLGCRAAPPARHRRPGRRHCCRLG
jgi:arginase family enzyme